MPSDHIQHFEKLRPKLIAFTLLQVPEREYAEDIVQDTMIAALESMHRSAGKASFDTWVFSILKNKLIDYIRKAQRERERFISDADDIDIERFFNDKDHWENDQTPSHWDTPEDLHLKENFWQVFDLCLLHLPGNTGRVFALRELMDLETDEICQCLEISEQNCWTILHRARLKLRSCLEKGWFQNEEYSA